ncbi:MAG: pentapeptide repeat-containing protein, partial [Planctomycetaceae bacterium]|nr:pentapeptide repeat-containing protein [Planctomycetaceae bacterium]
GVANLRGLNLSQFNLTGCQFLGDLTDVNFTDAVISKCDFGWLSNITIDQIKSTWNYKTGRMNGIKLPEEIQKTLDAEKNNPKK